MRTGPRHGSRAAVALALLFAAPILAGCTDTDARAAEGPIGVLEAVRLATPEAQRLAPSASLIAFEGHEGPPPSHLRGLVGTHKVPVDTSHDRDRGDGRAYAWMILFATYDGGLIKTTIVTAPYKVQTEWIATGGDAHMQGLWGLNMGGRLVVDTPQATQALRDSDAAIHRYLRDEANPNVVYTSEVAPSDISESVDLAHRIDIGYTDWRTDEYAYYGLVSHFSGRVLDSGDFQRGEEERTVTLVDEEFTLNLVQREGDASKQLPTTVYDTKLELVLSGNGRYTFELWKDNRTQIARYVGSVLGDERRHEKAMGTLEPATYTLHAEALGQVTFQVKVDGVVVG